ncbi:MAG: hypothetical protein GC159_18880 [Phycisphaera sp.]|nr:hypothetical protein [Phycisphaera sp.]
MKSRNGVVSLVLAGLFVGALTASLRHAAGAAGGDDASWTNDFSAEKADLTDTGRNPYFVLEPGFVLELADDDARLVITVLDETRVIDGVTTRVVEERESEGGELVEVSRNFFAISKRTNSVFYFGEEVDIYKHGKIVGHGGAWLSGEKGAKYGLAMPGQPLLRGRYYQELAPGVAMDRAEIVSLTETLKTPAGEMTNCLRTQESSPLEPGVKEFKTYAPGIGLIQDESLKLVRYGKAE